MKRIKHWQDPVNAMLGAWLVASPWVLGFSSVTAAATSTVAAGVILVALSASAMAAPRAWAEGVDAGLGALLMLTPALLGFDTLRPAFLNALVTGAAVAALALWVLVTDDDFDAAFQARLQ